MYEEFYGFTERPFSLLPDPDFLYLGEKHRTALDLLELTIFNQSGFCVVSGEIGAGKTTLVRELLNRLDDDIGVGLISNTHPSFGELLQWIVSAYDLHCPCDDRFELHKCFLDFVIQQYAGGKRTLLIIDEAQNLSVSALEELRMLSNVNSDKDLVLQIVLVGQNQLRDKLKSPELEQFAQRIAVDYHLAGMGEQETHDYIRHRVTHAGGSGDLFSAEACRTVFRCSNGIPRLINAICDLSLVYAYAEKSPLITAELVRAVVDDQRTGTVRKLYGDLPSGIPDLQPACANRVDQALRPREAAAVVAASDPVTDGTATTATTGNRQHEERPVADPGPVDAAASGRGNAPPEYVTILGSMNPILLQGGFESGGPQARSASQGTALADDPAIPHGVDARSDKVTRRRQAGLLALGGLLVGLGVAAWLGRGLWPALPVAGMLAADSGPAITQPGGMREVQPALPPRAAERRLGEQRGLQPAAEPWARERRLAAQPGAQPVEPLTTERRPAEVPGTQPVAEPRDAEHPLVAQPGAQPVVESLTAERRLAEAPATQPVVASQATKRRLAAQPETQPVAEPQVTKSPPAAQREAERLAGVQRHKAAEAAERREWERLVRIQRKSELEMAKRRAVMLRERQLNQPRENGNLAQIQRQIETRRTSRQVETLSAVIPGQPPGQAPLRKKVDNKSSQDLEARRAAAQAMWKQLSAEPEWSEELADE